MQPSYHIILRIKSGEEFEPFGQFHLAGHRSCAENIYDEMKGIKDGGEEMPIQIDFIEVIGGIPASLHIVACTLDELSSNVKIIAREIFKALNLHA